MRIIFAMVVWLLAAPVTGAAEPAAPKPASGVRDGTLEIVGNGVEKLVLAGKEMGQDRILDRPGPSVSLPAGQYWLKQIVLQGGIERRPTASDGFSIAPGKVHRLEVGTPPAGNVTAKRRGSVLKLNYVMENASGWHVPRNSSNAPRFTVYQGDREIGSGTFEYG